MSMHDPISDMLTRIRNAVLAKAYGDSPVLMRMVESLDDDQRNVSKALMKVAPTVAKMRQSIGEGALFDADLTPDLLAAVDALGTLRGKGRTVATELAQSDVFGGKYSDETREILAFLADNIRRPNQIAALIQQFAEVLGAAGNPNQGSLLGEATAPAKRDILAAARRELNDNDAAGNNGETGQGHRDAGAGHAFRVRQDRDADQWPDASCRPAADRRPVAGRVPVNRCRPRAGFRASGGPGLARRRGFRRQHAGFHGVVAALDARHVHEAGRAAQQRAAGEIELRHRLVTALGHGARAIATSPR